ncbi:MAG: ankyrin repeat domain-containing protein [Akkermansia sp.]
MRLIRTLPLMAALALLPAGVLRADSPAENRTDELEELAEHARGLNADFVRAAQRGDNAAMLELVSTPTAAPIAQRSFFLYVASVCGALDVVQQLVGQQGTDVNVRVGEDGETPLMAAVACGQLGVVNYLLQQGANPNVRDEDGKTPLHEACDNGSLPIVMALVGHGADINARDEDGETPLHEAKQPAIRDYLIARGAR